MTEKFIKQVTLVISGWSNTYLIEIGAINMGRIKTQLIKRISGELFEKHQEDLKDNFEQNKQIVGQVADIKSKKLRNTIAGYLTRLVKHKEEL